MTAWFVHRRRGRSATARRAGWRAAQRAQGGRPIFEGKTLGALLIEGLNEAIAFERGELQLPVRRVRAVREEEYARLIALASEAYEAAGHVVEPLDDGDADVLRLLDMLRELRRALNVDDPGAASA